MQTATGPRGRPERLTAGALGAHAEDTSLIDLKTCLELVGEQDFSWLESAYFAIYLLQNLAQSEATEQNTENCNPPPPYNSKRGDLGLENEFSASD